MKTIGETINELIDVNNQIWHKATKIKTLSGEVKKEKGLETKERVEIFLGIRELNAQRSAVRWQIDKRFNSGTNETKINFCKRG